MPDSCQVSSTAFLVRAIEESHAVVVPRSELKLRNENVGYIPHHSVYHPKKAPIHAVLDCPASFSGFLLNNELIQGSNLTNMLMGIMLHFRKKPVALRAVREGMFHQVRVTPENRDLLRFLWWPRVVFHQNLHSTG